ncbi:MAG: MFS transporter [Thermoplasmata archaeon]
MPDRPAPAPSARPPLPRAHRPGEALLVVAAATFMMVLDTTVVVVALPAIQQQFRPSFYRLELVLVVYVVAQGALLLLAGYLCDRFGRRLVFGLGVAGLGLTSLLCGLAPTIDALILARLAEGVASAFAFGAGLALLNAETPAPRRPAAFGLWAAVLGAGVAVGPIVGGVVVTLAGWPWIFFINVPIAGAVVGLTFTRVGESTGAPRAAWDLSGAALFIGAAATALVAAEQGPSQGWGSPWVVALLAGFVGCAVGFLWRERTAVAPMFDLTLFRRRGFLLGTLGTVVIALTYWSLFVYLPLYFQRYLGASPLDAGVALLPIALASVLTSLGAGRAAVRWGSARIFLVGMGLSAVGGSLLYGAAAGSGVWAYLPGLALVGAGAGLYQPEISRAALSAAPEGEAGVASAMNSTLRALSVAFGWAGGAVLFGAAVTNGFVARIAGGPIAATGLTSRLVAAIIPGEFAAGAALLPPALRGLYYPVARASFYDGLHAIFALGVVAALVGMILTWWIGLRGPRSDPRAQAGPAVADGRRAKAPPT